MDQIPPKESGGGSPAKKDQDEDDRDENRLNEAFRLSDNEGESGESGDESERNTDHIPGVDTIGTSPPNSSRNPNLRF